MVVAYCGDEEHHGADVWPLQGYLFISISTTEAAMLSRLSPCAFMIANGLSASKPTCSTLRFQARSASSKPTPAAYQPTSSEAPRKSFKAGSEKKLPSYDSLARRQMITIPRSRLDCTNRLQMDRYNCWHSCYCCDWLHSIPATCEPYSHYFGRC